MLTKKQVEEIREHLNKAQNPLFFFDNDNDGLCSFLLLQKYIGRGKGVPIRSFPELSKEFFRKVKELDADYIFILDKPVVSQDFLKEAEQINIPVVWIDHHLEENKIPEFVNYYNSSLDYIKGLNGEFKDNRYGGEPTTYLCYQVSQKKEDLWIAVIGCISDKFTPDFYSEFSKDYSDLSIKSKEAFDILYKSQIGKLARIFGFALKDRTTNVINVLKLLMKVKSPYEIIDENNQNYILYKRFNQINEKYQRLIKKAITTEKDSEGILFFQYGGDLSISSELSNELSYLFPKRIIVIMYLTGIKVNISVRGKGIRSMVLNAIKDLDEASGGGHENAVGAQVKIKDLEKFKENLAKLIKEN
ncbi:hypothetical protein CMI40_01080 [Candidatus Pacearchaeota archaeon]|jgi:single-stranded DNA-specific DHH superfamily exonuclease|nr:hypothetical protein [Candidatus Pacearchaeota archaeon]|tara:strand:- start:4255 stop:5334 length:1080 start_codon:yes stop_codon:yes gene_type:complete